MGNLHLLKCENFDYAPLGAPFSCIFDTNVDQKNFVQKISSLLSIAQRARNGEAGAYKTDYFAREFTRLKCNLTWNF